MLLELIRSGEAGLEKALNVEKQWKLKDSIETLLTLFLYCKLQLRGSKF